MPNKRHRPRKSKPHPYAYAAEPNGKVRVGHAYLHLGREYWLHPRKGWRSRNMKHVDL